MSIDYGMGKINIDKQTGIRYGVIPIHRVLQQWYDSAEPVYIYFCPYCGEKLNNEEENKCPKCKEELKEQDFYDNEPNSFVINDGEYIAESDSYGDIFIVKSPYYTYAEFCFPCAPGACYLLNPVEGRDNNKKCYCFGKDFFEDEKAPYKIYSVKTGKEII